MDIKNKKLEKFVKITLRGKPEDNFTLPGNQIVNLIAGILKEERQMLLEEVRSEIKTEFDRAEYNSEMAQWKGADINEQLFEEIKKKVLFKVLEKFKTKK